MPTPNATQPNEGSGIEEIKKECLEYVNSYKGSKNNLHAVIEVAIDKALTTIEKEAYRRGVEDSLVCCENGSFNKDHRCLKECEDSTEDTMLKKMAIEISVKSYNEGFRSGVLAAPEKVPEEVEKVRNSPPRYFNECRREAIKNIKGLLE